MEYNDYSAGAGYPDEASAAAAAAAAFYASQLPHPSSCDIKPRLNKEQHDFLEAKYLEQPKPNTHTKKGFAENLCVSLDKVNNWFQNRRAKTKQDIKKAQGAANLAHIYHSNNAAASSDTEPSPYHPSAQYATMMHQLAGNDANGLGIDVMHQQHPHLHIPDYTNAVQINAPQLDPFDWAVSGDFYKDDLNRRTLTQENFDAISRNGGMVNGHGHFEGLQAGFSHNQDVVHQVFGNMREPEMKQEDMAFPFPTGAPLSSHDSTVPSSNVSDQSYQFPSSNIMQGQANMSTDGLDWVDSRSSSLSMIQPDGLSDMSASQPQLATTVSQWQPGQSVPVDVGKHWEEFRQASQARASETQAYEQPLAFPSDQAYARRSSQASILAQSMGNVNIHTPQNVQPAVFKSPAPPTNIAARRQRPRPANLSLAARSASYNGAGQPGSPGMIQTAGGNVMQDQHLRRIRSAAVMNGGVAQGRIMKSTPGSAQRSPVNWTFSQAMISPHLARNMSHGSLAPPTPLSPYGHMQQEQQQSLAGDLYHGPLAHHPSISETSYENCLDGLPYQPSASVPPQHFPTSSPPVTPMYHDHPLMSRVGSHVITENTPPQSAPAGQSCFPSNIWAQPPPPPQQQPPPPHQQQPVFHHRDPFQTHGPNPSAAAPPPPPTTVTFAPSQQSNVTTGPPPGIPLQFANGIPTVTAEGTVKMSFPSQAQLLQEQSRQMGTPPLQQGQYAFVNNGTTPPRVAGELMVHEYTPPDAKGKSSAGSSSGKESSFRAVENAAPRSWTFANASSVDFEAKRAAREGAKANGGKDDRERGEGSVSLSPGSSCGSGSSGFTGGTF